MLARSPTGQNNGTVICGASHTNIGGASVSDYSAHHDPFQYYSSTANPAHKITINLEAQTVTDDQGFSATFDIDPFRKYCLLNGLDDIGLTLRHESKIDKFESAHDKEFWSSPKLAKA